MHFPVYILQEALAGYCACRLSPN